MIRIPGMLDLTGLFQIHGLPGYPQLRDKQFVPQLVPEFVQAPDPWTAIRARDILVHHPYESFSHVVDFIDAAADDDRVLAIKQTLYRTSSDSPVVRALQRAAENGKQVTAVIELKARLDEERNIVSARELEKSGVHVVFGFIGLKTHCKVALVVRREDDGIRRYVHLGTGNYNPQTARIYTDLGYFTCNPDFCEDASALFNYLTGYGELPQWRKLIVAPSRMQSFMVERIEAEAALQRAGKEGRIIAKLNGVLEPVIVQALYRASQAGVKIDLICRGICALRPGLAGVSDNIHVTSIVDRFLEHSRIYYFGNGGDPLVYIGSADWMDRNLSRRVEVVFPMEAPELKQRLIREILATTMADNVKARELLPDGTYRRLPCDPSQPRLRSQERFLEIAAENAAPARGIRADHDRAGGRASGRDAAGGANGRRSEEDRTGPRCASEGLELSLARASGCVRIRPTSKPARCPAFGAPVRWSRSGGQPGRSPRRRYPAPRPGAPRWEHHRSRSPDLRSHRRPRRGCNPRPPLRFPDPAPAGSCDA